MNPGTRRHARSWARRGACAGLLAAMAVLSSPASAELLLPHGFRVQVYVTGDGFDSSTSRGARGIPSVSTFAFDPSGVFYLARTGRRYVTGGEVEDIWPVYRIAPGGARLTPSTESQHFYGPPLRNPQIGAVRGERELFVTTYDRDRKIGALYRLVNGRAELFAGGTPDRGDEPVLRQPEGVAVHPGGLFVADRSQGVVVRLDPAGRVLARRYAELTRPRVLAVDDAGALWIGGDGAAEAPWQQAEGEIWHVSAAGVPRLVLRGPIAQGIALTPAANLLVADRHAARIFVLTPEGKRVELARFTDSDAPRSLAIAPVTPATRRAGIAGDLFVAAIKGGAYPVNEVLRVSGPLDAFVAAERERP